MKSLIEKLRLILLLMVVVVSGNAQQKDSIASKQLQGRWDFTILMDGKRNPSWLEVRHSGLNTLVGYFVGVSGSARPISEIKVDGNSFKFEIPPQWEQGNHLALEGQVNGDQLSGNITFPDGKKYSWTAVRAPALRRNEKISWGKPISLIPTEGLKGWTALGENQWVVEKGILKSPKAGANLVTEQKFDDFKLQVEFRYPKGSNSGVYLRGRYEVQITDSQGKDASPGEFGGVYGFIAPSDQVAKAAGEWQSFEVTLIGRKITLVANGEQVITNQEIPGITGGALDSDEGEPGPILLQGDHGAVEFRKIVITPAIK